MSVAVDNRSLLNEQMLIVVRGVVYLTPGKKQAVRSCEVYA